MPTAPTKALAREAFASLEIEDDESFIDIGGIETLNITPASTDADVGDYDSGGHAEHIVAERSETWQITGHMKWVDRTVANPVRDPGQLAVEALARKVGIDSLGQVRLNMLGGGTITAYATATLGTQGGPRTGVAAWGVTFTLSGEPVVNGNGNG